MSWHSEPEHIGVGSTELQSGVWDPAQSGPAPGPLGWEVGPVPTLLGGGRTKAIRMSDEAVLDTGQTRVV